MIQIKILILTGQNSNKIIQEIVNELKDHIFTVEIAPISVSAFLTEKMTEDILNSLDYSQFDLILLPGFVQWDTSSLEKDFSIQIRKGPEFASDLPVIIKNIKNIQLSNLVPANRLFESSSEKFYYDIFEKNLKAAKESLGSYTFYINEEKSDLIIGRNLPPPIIAEIVNCTEKDDENILKKAEHYIKSGADIIDIGCISNKPKPDRIKKIITLLNSHFDILLSIDSMNPFEIISAVDAGIDMILSLDYGNYQSLKDIPKTIPVVVLPTNIKAGKFPKGPAERVQSLIMLIDILQKLGFKKIIADPLLETPISPGICNSLEAYFSFKNHINSNEYRQFEVPTFFGISNVVELMDIDSVGINGLLASIAIELDVGVLFTVEHSIKLMGGVKELKESVKLNYISKSKNTPPINQGIQVFKAKGKKSGDLPVINEIDAVIVKSNNVSYQPDKKGYFKIYINHYAQKIYILFYSNEHKLINTLIGSNAESLCKEIIEFNLTNNLFHINYLGRELSKAEFCLLYGKPYIQDEVNQ